MAIATEQVSKSDVQRNVVHGSFRLERHYDAPRELVYHAFTDPVAKAAWFGNGGGMETLERSMDVRSGGREFLRGRCGADRPVSTFDALYFDVVPNERLVYAYEMHLDERKISASLATVEFRRHGAGTTVVMCEQGAFLDGYDDAGSREQGTQLLLEAVDDFLKK
jgi:uncharacterized protein YndB with AHSA1/START domain